MKILVSVFDRVAGLYNSPIVALSEAEAERTFKTQLTITASKNEQCAPFDYDLYKLGDFDEETGAILNIELKFVCHFEPVKTFVEKVIEDYKKGELKKNETFDK